MALSPRTLGIGALALLAAFGLAFAVGKATSSGSDEPSTAKAVVIEPVSQTANAPSLAAAAKLPALRVPKAPAASGGDSSGSQAPSTAGQAPTGQATPQQPPPVVDTPPSSPPSDSPPVADPAPE